MCNQSGSGQGGYGSSQGYAPRLMNRGGFQPTNTNPTFQNAMSYGNQRLSLMPGFQSGPAGQYGRTGGTQSGGAFTMPDGTMIPLMAQQSPQVPSRGTGQRTWDIGYTGNRPGDALGFQTASDAVPFGDDQPFTPAWQPGQPASGGSPGMSPQETLARAGIRTSPSDWQSGGMDTGTWYGPGVSYANRPGAGASRPQAPTYDVGGGASSFVPPGSYRPPGAPLPPQAPQQNQVGSPPSAFGFGPLMNPRDKPMQQGMMGNPMLAQNYNSVAGFGMPRDLMARRNIFAR